MALTKYDFDNTPGALRLENQHLRQALVTQTARAERAETREQQWRRRVRRRGNTPS
jgi:regulator of replication initiation timing